jgi:rhodanese-related sulfurtransferase
MVSRIDAVTLRAWLHDGKEIAVLDVSDGGPYARGHILVASNAPPATFEVVVAQLVPRRSSRMVLVDAGDESATAAANVLVDAGYSDVTVLEGGNPAWEASGFRLFAGSNIVSKAFGELVEEMLGTPHIEASELLTWQKDDREFVLVDARPLAEYRTVSLPGAADCPGAELVYRVPGLAADPKIPVVVNCAGRTRSIIGAQSLRDAGLPNPVFALKNGTMGWQIAGYDVVHGRSNIAPEPGPHALDLAMRHAASVAERDGITFIDASTLEAWRVDTSRTTYVFDVRQSDAFEQGHIPGSMNAAGGQLVQATDMYIAVRNARIVLVDEHCVQSVMTAHWMKRMGWNVVVLRDATRLMTESGPYVGRPTVAVDPRVKSIDSADLAKMIAANDCEVVDVGESYWYRQGRVPGSWWSARRDLARNLARFATDRTIVFCCTNGVTSPFVAADAMALGFSDVRWVAGGRSAWKRAGFDTEMIGDDDDSRLLSSTDDMWYPPWARKEGATEAMMQYLTWEVGLLDIVREETYVRFSLD